MTRLSSAWAELKSRAFPPGAVTFHLGTWSRGALTEEEGAAARALLAETGAERLLVLHGSAIRLRGETVVVVGHRFLDRQAFRAGILLAGRQTDASARRRFPIDRVVVVDDPRGKRTSWETDGRKMTPLPDVGARAPAGVAVLRCPAAGSRTEAWRDLALALRPARDAPAAAGPSAEGPGPG